MTARFTLAAQVLLNRRLKNFFRIDEAVEIDMSYVTCAEYQLFIDERRAAGKYVQPDQWKTERFPPGTAKQPITGVRASDADAFCEWLTQQHLTPGFRYRLPTCSEVGEYSIVEASIGCWCRNGKDTVIIGIEPQQWKVWREQLRKRLKQNNMIDLALDRALNLSRDLSRTLNLPRTFDFARTFNLAHTLNCDPALNRNLAFARDLHHAHAHAYALVRDLTHSPKPDDRDPILDLARNLVLYLAPNRDPALNFALNFALDFALAPDFHPNRDYREIRVYLLCFIIFWALLADIYSQAARKGNFLRRINRSLINYNEVIDKCITSRDSMSQLYCFFSLIDFRRQGKMPAWEGIRIVRERSDD